MPIVVSGASTPGTFESLVLNGDELNDDAAYYCEQILVPPPPKRQEWIKGTDFDGQQLLRPPLYDNRTVTLKLRQVQQPDTDSMLAAIGTIIDSIREAELNAEQGGVDLVWTPAGATPTMTFHVLSGEIVDMPVDWESSGWFIKQPVITIRLDCEPPGYGEWVLGAATVTNSLPVQTLTVSDVPGDMPAELVVRVTDAATQNRNHVEVGIQNRYYDAATDLLIDSTSLVTSGFAGSATTRTGAYSASGVIRATLTTTPVAVCGLGNLGHVGQFKIKTRVYPVIGTATATDMQIRLSWREGDGPLSSNEWVSCPAGTAAFSEIDLGYVDIPEATKGAQRWTGQIEAYSTTAGDTLDVDFLVPIPTGEGYGKARAPITFTTPTTFSARDEFDQAAGSLTGKTAPVGGTYVVLTGSDTDDFTIDTAGHTLQRTAVSDTGSGAVGGVRAVGLDLNLTATAVRFDWKASVDRQASRGFLVRVVDASNFFSITVTNGTTNNLVLASYISGTLATAKYFTVPIQAFTSWQTLAVLVDAAGRYYVWMAPQGDLLALVANGSDSVLATGGALATGDVYLTDNQSGATAVTRNYDNFFVWVPASDAVVFSGQSAEIRYDGAQRADSTGTYWGPISTYRGARPYLPEAGGAGRTCRLVVKARRNDVDELQDDHIADSTTVTVDFRPRYYVVPR